MVRMQAVWYVLERLCSDCMISGQTDIDREVC